MSSLTLQQQERLQSLQDVNGRITAEIVVEDARKEDSPLHSLFEWNVLKAAHNNWLFTARNVLSVYYSVKVRHTTVDIPYYIKDPSVKGNEPGYISINRIKNNRTLATKSMIMELKTIEGHLRRARGLAEYCGMEMELEEMLMKLILLRGRLEEEQAASQAVS